MRKAPAEKQNEPKPECMGAHYKAKVRIRVNGLLLRNDALLMVRLLSPLTQKRIWMPPGGGVQFGESLSEALEREFREETGLIVSTQKLRYVHEVLSAKIHAVELYYDCRYVSGTAKLGYDPELDEHEQMLEAVAYIPLQNFDDFDIVPSLVKKHLPSDVFSGFEGIREDSTAF